MRLTNRISDIDFSTTVARELWLKTESRVDSDTWILCGSISKNGELIEQVAEEMRRAGLKAITPRAVPWYPAVTVETKVDDILFYYRLIRLGKGIVVVNGNGGYYGKATTLEIGYCLDLDKEIYFYHEPAPHDLESQALVFCGRAKVGLPLRDSNGSV